MRLDRTSFEVYVLMMGVPFCCIFGFGGLIAQDAGIMAAGVILLLLYIGFAFLANTSSRHEPADDDIVIPSLHKQHPLETEEEAWIRQEEEKLGYKPPQWVMRQRYEQHKALSNYQ